MAEAKLVLCQQFQLWVTLQVISSLRNSHPGT